MKILTFCKTYENQLIRNKLRNGHLWIDLKVLIAKTFFFRWTNQKVTVIEAGGKIKSLK